MRPRAHSYVGHVKVNRKVKQARMDTEFQKTRVLPPIWIRCTVSETWSGDRDAVLCALILSGVEIPVTVDRQTLRACVSSLQEGLRSLAGWMLHMHRGVPERHVAEWFRVGLNIPVIH